MKPQYNTALNLVVAILLCSIVGGCTSLESIVLEPTVPNEPYSGPYPSSFNELADKNPLLAQELTKLPELQDGISEEEAIALKRIKKLYNKAPDAFDRAFAEIYNVGIPEVRKYCAPLQATFWLAEDAKVEKLTQIINSYTLETLLQNAWIFELIERELYKEKVLELSETQIKMIADELIAKDPDEKILVQGGLENHTINDLILIHFKENRNHFSKKAKKIIKDSLVDIDQYKKDDKNHFRWKDFDTVVERLNAPELIDYYSRKVLRWVDYRTIPTTPPRWTVSPEYVFKHKKGNCVAITDFIIHCLQRGGYRAFELLVPDVKYVYHSLCVFEKNGEKYLMDNGRTHPNGILPYSMKNTYFE